MNSAALFKLRQDNLRRPTHGVIKRNEKVIEVWGEFFVKQTLNVIICLWYKCFWIKYQQLHLWTEWKFEYDSW